MGNSPFQNTDESDHDGSTLLEDNSPRIRLHHLFV